MKKLLLLILFIGFIGQAQENNSLPVLFSFSEPMGTTVSGKASTSQKMNSRIQNSMNIEIRQVWFEDIQKMVQEKQADSLNPNYFEIRIPKRNKKKKYQTVLAIPQRIESKEDGSYLYVAELVKGENTKGSLVLTHENGQNFGSMTLGKRSFIIESMEQEGDFLIELDDRIINNKEACGTTSKTAGNSNKSAAQQIAKAVQQTANATGSTNVRVLVCFTDRANNVSNPNQLATTLMAETNTSLRNSQVNSSQLTFSLAGVRRINFNEGVGNGGPQEVIDLLERAVINPQINALRDDIGVDLVVVLTDGNFVFPGFGTILGIATLNEYSFADTGFVALVEADAGGLTFAHEVGHLMGCRHDDDSRTPTGTNENRLPPNLRSTAKGHSWFKRNCFFCQRLFRKSVVANGRTRGIPRMFYSNPDVRAERKDRDNTGTPSRNNAEQLRLAAPVVAAYNSFEEARVTISGPTTVFPGDNYTLTANATNCPGVTYRWERSFNGFNYSFFSNNRSISDTAFSFSNNENIYYRVTITCSNGQTRTAFRNVFVFGGFTGPDDPFFATAPIAQEDDIDTNNGDKETSDMLIYPNPANEEVFLPTNFSERGPIEVLVINILTGKSTKLYKGSSTVGEKILGLNVAKLQQGLYDFKLMQNGKEVLSKRLLISR